MKAKRIYTADDIEVIDFDREENFTSEQLKEATEFLKSNLVGKDQVALINSDLFELKQPVTSNQQPATNNKLSDDWKRLDKEALRIFNQKAKLSNSLLDMRTAQERAQTVSVIDQLQKQYDELQLQKRHVEQVGKLPDIIQEKVIVNSELSASDLILKLKNKLRPRVSQLKADLKKLDASSPKREAKELQLSQLLAEIHEIEAIIKE